MSRLVVLSLGIGKLQLGFENVTARIYESGTSLDPRAMQFTGGLPAAPDIAEIYTHWQLVYSSFYKQFNPRIKINDAGDMKNISGVEFVELCSGLRDRINRWLNAEPFRKIDQQIRKLSTSEEIGFIETDDPQLRRLPWHLWNFFEDYPKAEVALSAPEYQTARKRVTTTPSSKVRILAILGNREGIAVERDRGELEQRSDASPTFLVEPQLEELNEQLWSDGWDILFFAGHSSSADKGIFQINEFDSIKLDKLRDALSRAISGGLKLAIFNSCDGLGLAEQLADLHIPQVIVMREPVPDVVATEFLKHFLEAFSSGQSLYASVRSAREQLKRLEIKYPTASWLPVICRNPAEPLTTWQELRAPNSSDSTTVSTEPSSRQTRTIKRSRVATMLLASIAITASVMGVRYLGFLQNWELEAFDQIVRLRPPEKPDPRILVVSISENDLRSQDPKLKRGSISDWALNKVLEKLEQRQARVIGLDIYRDFPTPRKDLAARFQSDRLVSVCKARDPESLEAVAPPPGVTAEQQGFSDVLQDPNGVVRRHLLAMDADETSSCTASYALSVGLALRYLAAQGKVASFTKEGFLQVGNVVFKPLQPHTSGYQGIDSWGYQVLLNYRSPRSPQNVVTQISLMQVLLGPLNPNLVKDRVVLIGVTAGSSSDQWTTPYSLQESGRKLPGVLLQAQMVSQILSAVLDHRPLLWTWPIWGEAIWIWGWALVGGALALCWRSPVRLAMVVGFALGVLYALCFSLLAKGGWVPLVPSAIALVSTGVSVTIYTISQANDGCKKADKKV